MRVYFDGQLVFGKDATKFQHDPQNIWLTSIAVSRKPESIIDDTKLPAFVDFASMRFFSNPKLGAASSEPTPKTR